MRTEIKKQKTKRIKMILSVRREKRRGKEQTIIDDNLTTISRHAPLRVEKDTVTHLGK
jgi:hypothetical protein